MRTKNTKNQILEIATKIPSKHTLSYVIQNDLCTGCGTCAAICPSNAIKMEKDNKRYIYSPKINEQKCKNCDLCIKICPGYSVDFEQLNREVFGHSISPTFENVLLGNHIKCYAGYSTNYNIRYDSSSGGLITQLLLYALKKRLIDGALVTRMNRKKPLEAEPFIARTPEEIIEASKSKYCPVPANVALEEIIKEKQGKYAVVGLPCQIHGLRKAEAIHKDLSKKIVMRLGIFCSHSDNAQQTKYLLYRFGIDERNVARIDYRGKGWPGMLTIKLKSGNEVTVPLDDWMNTHIHCLFIPRRCLLCCDHTAELADASFGDAWLPEFEKDTVGTSIVVSRTEMGENVLRKAMLDQQIKLKTISSLNVAESQKMFHFKKSSVLVRFLFYKSVGRKVPFYNVKLLKPRLFDWPRSGVIFINRYIAKQQSFWRNLEVFAKLQSPLKKMYLKVLEKPE